MADQNLKVPQPATDPSADGSAAHLARAQALRTQGSLEGAAESYRQAIRLNPGLADAHNGLGITLIRLGQGDQAIAAFRAAVAAAPAYPEAFNNLGSALDDRGRRDDAIDAFRAAIRLRPNYTRAYVNLAASLRSASRLEEAEKALRTAIDLAPQNADALHGLGATLRLQNRIDEAIAAFTKALELRPSFPEALNDLGDALQEKNRFAEAEAAYRAAIAARPNYAEAFTNLGGVLCELGRFDEARQVLEAAIDLRPDLQQPRVNLGAVLVLQSRAEEAEVVLRRALAMGPPPVDALVNLAGALGQLNRRGEAEAHYRHALRLSPDSADAHYGLALAVLARGELAEGWRENEWRWKTVAWGLQARNYAQPEWRGESLAGRTIMLYSEQGSGDVIHFGRYAKVLAMMGGRVVLDVYKPLLRLMATVPGVAQVIEAGREPPPFDFQLPLMSVPRVLGTTLETIPADVPYISADPAAAAIWKQRLAGIRGLKVGLVWAGDARLHLVRANAIDRRRSIGLAQLMPVLNVPGVAFISLQKGQSAAQIDDLPVDRRPIDHMDEMADFADTAALVANLDLVVTVDTSVAHLAGAMAKPVWILSRFDGCWRWLEDRDDSPWYPTARLFRQRSPGDWDEVVARVAGALTEFTARARARI